MLCTGVMERHAAGSFTREVSGDVQKLSHRLTPEQFQAFVKLRHFRDHGGLTKTEYADIKESRKKSFLVGFDLIDSTLLQAQLK